MVTRMNLSVRYSESGSIDLGQFIKERALVQGSKFIPGFFKCTLLVSLFFIVSGKMFEMHNPACFLSTVGFPLGMSGIGFQQGSDVC